MNKFLIIPNKDDIENSISLAGEYGFGFEFNDFFSSDVLDSEEKMSEIIDIYASADIPKLRTSHGAFFDVVVFSNDALIREVSEKRVKQSISAARRVGAEAVVFHTNHTPCLKAPFYLRSWEDRNYDFWSRCLEENSDISIYMENMFDDVPEVLAGLAQRLCGYHNFGVCLDYAHACVFGNSPDEFVDVLHPYVKHIHINDNDLREDLHLPVGSGSIDWNRFSEHYNRYFGDCTVLIENSDLKSQRSSAEFLCGMGLICRSSMN